MSNKPEYKLPVWAPRLRKAKIAQLYAASGRGIVDEELVDDVGYSLYARAESILAATRASRGNALCPNCEHIFEHDHNRLKCPDCNWECPWEWYMKTIKYKHLNAGGLKPFLEDFVSKFPNAKTASERLILIDTLIHRYHWESSTGGGRPGACCLIEGKMNNIMPFLDGLSYGNDIPEEINKTRDEWRKKWQNNKWKPRIENMMARDRNTGKHKGQN